MIELKIAKGFKIFVSIAVIAALLFGTYSVWQSDKHIASGAGEDLQEEWEMPYEEYENGFNPIATSGDYTMLANLPTSEIVVKNNKTGAMWYSNPQDRSEDQIANIKTQLSSQLIIRCEEVQTGTISTVDSYLGSVYKGGMTYELIDNGVRFTYRFPQQGVSVPLDFVLEDGAFKATVVSDDIEELFLCGRIERRRISVRSGRIRCVDRFQQRENRQRDVLPIGLWQ